MNEGDHHAVTVHDSEVGSVALALQWNGEIVGLDDGIWTNSSELSLRKVLAKKLVDRHLGEVGICERTRHTLKREALCFDHVVENIGGSALELSQIDLLENIEHHQRGKPLAVGRQLVEGITVILDTTWLYPLASVSFQIIERQISANRFKVISHYLCYRSLIKRTASLSCERAECARQIRILENIASLRCHVAGKVGFCRVFLLFNHGSH